MEFVNCCCCFMNGKSLAFDFFVMDCMLWNQFHGCVDYFHVENMKSFWIIELLVLKRIKLSIQ